MTERRIREVYADYRKGLIPFDEVVRASDEFLERYAQDRREAGLRDEPGQSLLPRA
ncbi:MAG: hypothetical protein M0R75_01900 [Dehalococcoidia bacterium]|nr:hypothetical protein [Dehalococcoidia bacterium]